MVRQWVEDIVTMHQNMRTTKSRWYHCYYCVLHLLLCFVLVGVRGKPGTNTQSSRVSLLDGVSVVLFTLSLALLPPVSSPRWCQTWPACQRQHWSCFILSSVLTAATTYCPLSNRYHHHQTLPIITNLPSQIYYHIYCYLPSLLIPPSLNSLSPSLNHHLSPLFSLSYNALSLAMCVKMKWVMSIKE